MTTTYLTISRSFRVFLIIEIKLLNLTYLVVPVLKDVDRRRLMISIVWEFIRTTVHDNVVMKHTNSIAHLFADLLTDLTIFEIHVSRDRKVFIYQETCVNSGARYIRRSSTNRVVLPERVTEMRPMTRIICRTMSHQ